MMTKYLVIEIMVHAWKRKEKSINNKKIKGDQHVWNLSIKWNNFYELFVYLIIILAFCK
jgi:hypothetical protein